MSSESLISWLLEGDISIQYQVYRDLLEEDIPHLQKKIETEGWGMELLSRRKEEGHWGSGFYNPKWISSHYTLLDIKNLCISPDVDPVKDSIRKILDNEKGSDGGVNPGKTVSQSDVCVNGMLLNYAAYFQTEEVRLKSVVDFILSQVMPDGGFNCRLNRSGARHSSLHSTICVMEGIEEYRKAGYHYRLDELIHAKESSAHFILKHQLFLSDRTGEIIDKRMLRFSWPCRWRYDILRAMEYFSSSGSPFDPAMKPALEIIIGRKRKDGTWLLQAKHPGQVHLDMETPGKPSRINTLRAMRVLKSFPEF